VKLPAKVSYASRAIFELARHDPSRGPLGISAIAKAQGIPRNFLLQLMMRLKNAGIVTSTRGVAGGYHLARRPEDINLADIVAAVDESILEMSGRKRSWGRADATGLIASVWDEINAAVRRRLFEVTIRELLERSQGSPPDFQI
jgi:Rrf2 family protein